MEQHVPASSHRLLPTNLDRLADELSEEFAPFTVWIDFRPMQEGTKHWHARQADWSAEQIIHAYDYDDMRRELIIYASEHPGEFAGREAR